MKGSVFMKVLDSLWGPGILKINRRTLSLHLYQKTGLRGLWSDRQLELMFCK